MYDDACYCDYDNAATVLHEEIRTARKAHRCSECRGAISAGEQYRHTWGVWPDGGPGTYRACTRCLDAIDWVTAHAPCVCWTYSNILDDLADFMRDFPQGEAPGLAFGFGRRLVRINRANAALKSKAGEQAKGNV